MAENIFNEKQDYIVAARDEVIKRDEYAANIDRMKQQREEAVKKHCFRRKVNCG